MPERDSEKISIDPSLKRKIKNAQFFRFSNEVRENQAWLLLERENLTADEIIQFCHGDDFDGKLEERNIHQKSYRSRRIEIQRLLEALPSGGAWIDNQGRLLPVTTTDDRGPPLPPLPALNQNNGVNNNGNNNNIPPPPPLRIPLVEPHDALRRDAEAAIARAVDRYRREQGVPDEDLRLIRLDIQVEPPVDALTVRRILIAVTAVVLAFVCMLLQTLGKPASMYMFHHHTVDPIRKVILKQRDFMEHILQCKSPTNRTAASPHRFLSTWDSSNNNPANVDCRDGVLLIPSVNNLIRAFTNAKSSRELLAWEEYILPEAGINGTWWLDCADDSRDSRPMYMSPQFSSECVDRSMCFRGVHDDIITATEVQKAIRLGKSMIEDHGGDHFDIHYDLSFLRWHVPTILSKVELLLGTEYHLSDLQPVAFRVYAAGPMNGNGVQADHLSFLLNKSNYRHWTERMERRNSLARHFPVPWPLTIFQPVRETCNVLADRQVDTAFDIQVTVFLSGESTDGLSLFVDEMKDVVTRGLAIESTIGRIVVSTTGHENRRCRLPSRSGVRAALQIWWSRGTSQG